MKYILFDLDGTLTDPGEGITNSIVYALKKFDITVEDKRELYCFIGPPLLDAFIEKYGFSPDKAYLAIEYYREYFTERGIFENELYDGIPQLLASLRKDGYIIALATSKPQPFAETILRHFDIISCFDYIKGSDLAEKHTQKAEIVADVISHFSIGENDKAVMIGDRFHDIVGAKKNNLPSIGVLYGYGSREEFEKYGADYIAGSVSELPSIINKVLE